MVTVPADFVVTFPLESTDATSGFDDVHVTLLSVALFGDTFALNCIAVPEYTGAGFALLTDMLLTGI